MYGHFQAIVKMGDVYFYVNHKAKGALTNNFKH